MANENSIEQAQQITPSEEERSALCSEINRLHAQLQKQQVIERKYEESQERFRVVFEQSRFGNKIINSSLEIVQVNEAIKKMLGYSEEELIGSKIVAYSHPDHVNHWLDLQVNLWTRSIPSFQIETCLVRKDGSSLWCSITSILFRDNNATLGYSIIEDISDRKALEEKLAKHTASINSDLENFVYTASHDLKSPISNIEGLIKALTKDLTKKFVLDEHQNMMFSMIGTSLNRLKSTISYLAKVSDAQKEDTTKEIVDINRLIDEVYEDLGTFRSQAPIALNKNIEVEQLMFSRENLKSIFFNLLSNAVKYISSKRNSEITIKTQRKNNFIVIYVEDNGIGISKSNLPKLFTMFKRFYTGVDGTGIGLYITKRIVESAGGKIEVESDLDVGTLFKVYLPDKD